MKTYLDGPMDYAKTLKLRTRVRTGPGPTRKNKEVRIPVARRRRKYITCTEVPLWQSNRVE